MDKKENAPTGAATSAGASTEAAALDGAALSNNQFITVSRDRQPGFIESLLIREGGRGAENAISSENLVMLAGLSDKRILQAEIEHERSCGALILSKCTHGGGYYLPASRAELVAFERTLRRRALGTLRTLRSARQALKIMEGQEAISGAETQSGEKL